MAAAAFARSSPRLEAWVLGLPTIGPLVRDHRDGLGMPRRAKTTAAAMITLFVTLSAWLLDSWSARAAVVLAGATGLYVVLLRVPTKGSATGGSSPRTRPPDRDRRRRRTCHVDRLPVQWG